MSHRFTPTSTNTLALVITTSLFASATAVAASAEELLSRSPERGGIGLELQLRPASIAPFEGVKPPRSDLNKLDERLSILVTDKASTSAIKFSEVMQKLAADMKVDNALTLFQRWWDTANRTPANISGRATNVYCDSEAVPPAVPPDEQWTKNGFPYRCPRPEGKQATLDPFANEDDPIKPNWSEAYTAIAFSNRFDLADTYGGQHCGEFRVVFARNSGFTNAFDRNLIIFEALVPNPNPPKQRLPTSNDIFANLVGCRPIVEFWRSLSDPMSTAARGTALHDFFLKGLPKDKIGPVVDERHYAGGPASGQIRTNQFMDARDGDSRDGGFDWTLREFKTDGTSIVPATVKSNPGNALFGLKDPRSVEFAAYLVSKDALEHLMGPNGAGGETSVDTFAFGLTTACLDHFNSFESDERIETLGDVVESFVKFGQVGKAMNAALAKANSKLTTENIMRRIRTQTCAGCHHYSVGDQELKVKDLPNGWPTTLGSSDGHGFTHVTEREMECGTDVTLNDLPSIDEKLNEKLKDGRPRRRSHLSFMGPDGADSRYKISDTLKFVLLPPRFENMVIYLSRF